jgi:hypothetical protein
LMSYCQLMGGFDEFITFSRHFVIEHSTWKQSPLFYECHLSFKFRSEISFQKTEIRNLQVHPWSLLKLFAMPLCINVSIWIINFVVRHWNFVKWSSNMSTWLHHTKRSALHLSPHPEPAVQRNLPSWF